MKDQVYKLKTQVKQHVFAALLSSYLVFGGDIPLPKALVRPLFYLSKAGYLTTGVLAKACTVLKVLRFFRLTGLYIPMGMLISATAFSYRVCYAAMVVEVKHHKLNIAT